MTTMLRGTWRTIVLNARWTIRAKREHVLFWVGRRMPRSVRYFATVVSCAEATTGRYSDTLVPEITMMEMLKRVGDKGR